MKNIQKAQEDLDRMKAKLNLLGVAFRAIAAQGEYRDSLNEERLFGIYVLFDELDNEIKAISKKLES